MAGPTAIAATTVVPASSSNSDGNAAAVAPFFAEYISGPSMRFQQVYSAAEFSSFGSEGALITAILFRYDNMSGGIGSTIANIQFNMSTTARGPDTLSSVFSENLGSDDTVVRGPGSFSVEGAIGGGTLRPFNVRVALSTPFLYQPGAGNLLLDIRNFSEGTYDPWQIPALDAVNVAGDSISIAYSRSVADASAFEVLTWGLVTQFEFTPVPEPGLLGLGGLAGLVLEARCFRRRAEGALRGARWCERPGEENGGNRLWRRK